MSVCCRICETLLLAVSGIDVPDLKLMMLGLGGFVSITRETMASNFNLDTLDGMRIFVDARRAGKERLQQANISIIHEDLSHVAFGVTLNASSKTIRMRLHPT